MNRRHISAIARKEWLHITRDPLTIFLLAIGPVLMLILISYAMATNVKDVPTVVYDQDQTPQSKALVSQLNASKTLHVTGYVDSTQGYERKLERRQARVVVIIDQGFAQQLTTPSTALTSPPKYRFVIDGTDPISAETATEEAVTISEQYVVS